MSQGNRIRSAWALAARGLLAGLALAAIHTGPARACSTPVYRYAMYNWPTAPYYVFFFHQGEIAEADQSINALIETAGRDETTPANVALEPVDLAEKEQLERLPRVVLDSREAHADDQKPLHLVYSAWGTELFAGQLDQPEFAAMINSPARKRLGELLAEGNAAILLVLTGPDEKKNEHAEQVAAKVAAEASAGKIPGGLDPGFPAMSEPPLEQTDQQDPGAPNPGEGANGDGPADAGQEASPSGFKVAVLKLSRTDPTEKWLVRTLLSVEPDLHEFAEEAMVFAVYGRGRAMPPYVGKGITDENLLECLMFLAGPCSCMVKDDNPGMDLLMQWDWEATAEAMAANDETLSAGPFGYEEFMPEEPTDEPAPGTGAGTAEASEVATNDAPDAAATVDAGEPAPQTSSDTPDSEVAQSTASEDAPNQIAVSIPSEELEAEAAAVAPVLPPAESESFAARQAWKLGVGFAAAAVFVVAIGLVLVLVRRPG